MNDRCPMMGLVALVGIVLVACDRPIARSGLPATVERIPNGNTLDVRLSAPLPATPGTAASSANTTEGSPTTERVRLLGLDAPDLRQNPWGVRAQQTLTDLVAGEQVWLEFDRSPRDRFGRLLAYVWHDDRLVNEWLLAEGHGIVSDRADGLNYVERLQHAQGRARILELGVWDPAKPLRLSPADFRAQNP